MTTKAKAHFQGPLLQLQARFTEIYPDATEQEPVNPMAPEHLCSAFTEAIQALDIQIRERLILLKQFDRYVISNLGMLLDEANRILIQAGVIPNFRYHGKSSATQAQDNAKPAKGASPQAEMPRSATSETYTEDSAVFE